MITNPILLWTIAAGALLLAAAACAPLVIPSLTRIWRKATPFGRFTFIVGTSASILYGGTKTNGTESADGTSTNRVMLLIHRLLSPDARPPSVTPADIARGLQRVETRTNANVNYTMPEGAALATNWWLRGAFTDVTPVSNLWVHSWGKVRSALGDTNELAAIGAPMSALPGLSRLWSAADSNGAFRITWENFARGRIPIGSGEPPATNCQFVSAQIELLPNGDRITRSNTVETVWRRIDPNDYDGDGYLNGDDPSPCCWDDGADSYYGPQGGLPPGCNPDAYCDVTIEVTGPQSQWVTFTGDAPSDYPDPQFLAKPGFPYAVKILIGKTYRIDGEGPIQVTGYSDEETVVTRRTASSVTVRRPILISETLLPGCFSLDILPPALTGEFYWSTNTCCNIIDNGNGTFSCGSTCPCAGCRLEGSYLYEGYSYVFDDVVCSCLRDPHGQGSFGINAPTVVFKDGALRPLVVSFSFGGQADLEGDELQLRVVGGEGKVRLWEDERKSREASVLSWRASSFSGCTYYVEGVNASDSADDICFDLTWSSSDGTVVHRTATTTCAEVKETQVDSPTAGITDGSPNPQPFAGHTNWNFDVQHSLHPDKHFAVLFRDVVNDDFSVRDFSVRMTLIVNPPDAPVGTASWFPLDPTPASGSIVSTGARVGELRDPKVGGVYHIGSCFSGSPTNECNIVLPLAGAEMYGILSADLSWADRFAATGKAKLPKRWLERVKFGCKWFLWLENGYYRGRPNNHQHPTVWHYNQVDDFDGLGAIGTLRCHPIRVEKLSNFIAGYTCVKIGVPWHERVLAQSIGTTNDLSATLSWRAGEKVAKGIDFDASISNFLENAHLDLDEKTSKLWPNTAPVDNHRGYPGHGNFDMEFSSPGFIYAQP